MKVEEARAAVTKAAQEALPLGSIEHTGPRTLSIGVADTHRTVDVGLRYRVDNAWSRADKDGDPVARVYMTIGRVLAHDTRYGSRIVSRTLEVREDDTLNHKSLMKAVRDLAEKALEDERYRAKRAAERAEGETAQVEVRDHLERLFPGTFRDTRYDEDELDVPLRTFGKIQTALGEVSVDVREGGCVDVKLKRTYLTAAKAADIITTLQGV